MDQSTIQENNRLIAEFMGVPLRYDDVEKMWLFNVKGFNGIIQNVFVGFDSSEYDSNWSWLMPVVEKIESLFNDGLQFYIKDTRAYIEVDTQASLAFDIPDVPECYSGMCDTKLEAVYSTVVEFIKWFNSQSK